LSDDILAVENITNYLVFYYQVYLWINQYVFQEGASAVSRHVHVLHLLSLGRPPCCTAAMISVNMPVGILSGLLVVLSSPVAVAQDYAGVDI
jgi:hypothetical protein